MPVLLDVESVSRADLKRVGGRRYWEHPSSRMLCATLYDTDSGELELWLPGDAAPELAKRPELAAHNGRNFDRFATLREWGTDIEIDTSELARKSGMRGALDALSGAKDKVASRYTKSLSKCDDIADACPPFEVPAELDAADAAYYAKRFERDWQRDKHGANWYSAKHRRNWKRLPRSERHAQVQSVVAAYNCSDVEIMAHAWSTLEPWLDVDAETSRVERIINDRGIRFDSQLAQRLLACDARLTEQALAAIARSLGITAERTREIAGSPAQFCDFTGLCDATKATVAQTIATASTAGALEQRAVLMCRARQARASIVRGKLQAGLARVQSDGIMRDLHRYYAAHTGRWGGVGMQWQNFPRPAKQFEDWGDEQVCALADAALAGRHLDAAEIVLCLRACAIPRPGNVFAVCDFSGVEARGTAWCADDWGALDVFASGRDPYRVAAAAIFGVSYDAVSKEQRQAGKVSELACGYGGGAGALEGMAAGMGIDLAASGVDAQAIVDAWRELHAPIVRFWYAVERAFAAACRGDAATVDCFSFVPASDGSAVAAILPSGRPIVYPAAQAGRDHKGRLQLSYQGPLFREHTYGGALTENLIQALCRDLLADAMVRCERDGLPIVLHVHDEIVAEVPASAEREGYEYLHEVMTTLPEWAAGFPIAASGHTGKRYRK